MTAAPTRQAPAGPQPPRRAAIRPAAAAGLLALAAAGPARADDLSVLAYPVLVWPAGGLVGLVFIGLTIWLAVRLKRRRPSRALVIATAACALLLGGAYTLLVLAISHPSGQAFWDLKLISLIPVWLLIATAGLLAWLLGRRAPIS